MKLYHVSFDLDFTEEFIPRVPQCLKETSTENRDIPRICFSTTIEGCLSAVPGASDLESLLASNQNVIRVCEIDTELYGLCDKDLLMTEEIYKNDYVKDAYVTDEVWVLKEIKMRAEDSYLALIDEIYKAERDCFPSEVLELAETAYEGDVEEAYFELFPEKTKIPVIEVVEDVELIGGAGTEFPLELDTEIIDAEYLEADEFAERELIEEIISLKDPELVVGEAGGVEVHSVAALEKFLRLKCESGRWV